MSDITGIRLALSVLNLVGSSLSAIGAGFICLCYLFVPPKAHFRHRLIQNLAIADFLNATSNSASGFYILVRNRNLPDGLGCKLNGLVTQITVQATDLSIFAIAIVTVWVITKPTSFGDWNSWKTATAVSFIWLLPFITGFTALGNDWYHPASGNWCWIQKHPVHLRYALTHGWRFFVILSVIILYTYLYFFLRRTFQELRKDFSGDRDGSQQNRGYALSGDITCSFNHESKSVNGGDQDANSNPAPAQEKSRKGSPDPNPVNPSAGSIHVKTTMTVSDESPRNGVDSRGRDGEMDSLGVPPPTVTSITGSAPSRNESPRLSYKSTDYGKKVNKVLLMRGYPTFYVILWIPGIANRMVEACGRSSKVLQLMQASTQFVGLANAITYGLNEKVVEAVKTRFGRKRQTSGLYVV